MSTSTRDGAGVEAPGAATSGRRRWDLGGTVGRRRPVGGGRLDRCLDTRVLVAVSATVAALSLLGPGVPHYDPWAWLIWGRQIIGGGLDTFGGPAWKPLPVLVTAPLSLAGSAAPTLWLIIARGGALLGLGLAVRLADRFVRPTAGAGAGTTAGALAVAALVLTPGGDARWIRHTLQGNIEPLLVALCLGAVERHLDGRRGHALVLGTLAALARPEVWPFLGAYGAWLFWREPGLRGRVAGSIVAVGVLWFGGDWWGSGELFAAASRARVFTPGWETLVMALGTVTAAAIVPVWVGAAAGVLRAWRRREAPLVILAGGALAYLGVVVVMSAGFGYAGLGRFVAPPVAVLCVVAGVGFVRGVTAVGTRWARWALAVGLGVVSVGFAAPRADWVVRHVTDAGERSAVQAGLDVAIARAGGREAVLACEEVAIDQGLVEVKPALAWDLDILVGEVEHRFDGAGGVVFARAGEPRDRRLGARVGPGVGRLASTEDWAVYSVGCPVP